MRSSLANRQSTFGRFPTAGLCRAPHPSGSYLSQGIMRLWSCGGLHREGPGLAPHCTQFSFCVTKSHLFMTQASLLWELPPILGKHLSPNIIWIQYVDDLLCSVMAVDIQHLLQVLAHRGCNVSKCKMQFIALKCLGHGMSPKGKTLFLKRINTINIFLSLRQCRGFLQLVGYCQTRTRSWTVSLTRNSLSTSVFWNLKSSPPILRFPNYSSPFPLFTHERDVWSLL